jgi:uncharacterized protein (TIGR02594 family)
MQYMKIAESLIGQKEIKGSRDNPIIMLMFQTLGHDWVEHDETPWCAAYVGYCLEEGGIRSTRKLNARSYESYGQLVYKPGKKGKLSDARKGDICVFSRGNSSWQGHVAFYTRHTAKSIYVLGGNQRNAINIKPYSRSRLVCIVRPVSDFGQDSMTLRQVQQRLKDLGYHEVGKVDGIIGTKTRGAILAFREDNGLPLTPTVDAALEDALKVAPKRFVSSDRANGKPKGSRILSGAKRHCWNFRCRISRERCHSGGRERREGGRSYGCSREGHFALRSWRYAGSILAVHHSNHLCRHPLHRLAHSRCSHR